jgi:4-hydroxyphenylpyruvate dioxygenase-like putative hemolysin
MPNPAIRRPLRRRPRTLRAGHGLARRRCQQALAHAVSKGAEEYTGDDKTLDVPAIVGIGGSLLYFVDTYGEGSNLRRRFRVARRARSRARRVPDSTISTT